MGLIALEGMRFYAYHGVYKEEQAIGNYYVIDVYLNTSFNAAIQEDDIYKTINYETVFLICKTVMKKKTKLIETLAAEIINSLKHQFNTIKEARVRIVKENPLAGEMVSNSMVELSESLSSKCPRCSRSFLCYNDDNCWCMSKNIHPISSFLGR